MSDDISMEITEVVGLDAAGSITLCPVFRFEPTGTDAQGGPLGEFSATGYLPSYLDQFLVLGLVRPGEAYL